jgi:hypothetical protein
MHATATVIADTCTHKAARYQIGDEATGCGVRASELACDLSNVARRAVGE